MLKRVEAGVLEVGYEESGDPAGWPAVLVHGFPYDVHAYDDAAKLLAAKGARVILPYMRGYGPTRFLSPATPRSGQQGAFGADLLALLDALDIRQAALGGYDWGGRAACVTAALWPERVRCLVSINGYNIIDVARSGAPLPPAAEHRFWYQYYFHSERGRAGLAKNRRELCKYLWRLWSPTWAFDEATFERTAPSLDNPDFVAISVHSYRHRFALAPGDPAYDEIERRLAGLPPITVPTVTLDGADDGVVPSGGAVGGGSANLKRHFTGPHEHRIVAGAGHNLPQEKPEDFADAVLRAMELAG